MSNNNISPAITPLIICGGPDISLWPLSRTGLPKEFLVLSVEDSNQSLFQKVITRINSIGNDPIKLVEDSTPSVYESCISQLLTCKFMAIC